jgi:hypothetical protein
MAFLPALFFAALVLAAAQEVDVVQELHAKSVGQRVTTGEEEVSAEQLRGDSRDSYRRMLRADQSRIIGGTAATAGEYPFMTCIKRKTERRCFCGGSVIGVRHILTAAHCLASDTVPGAMSAGASPAELEVRIGRLKPDSDAGGAVIEYVFLL